MGFRFPGREGDDLGPPPPPFRINRRRIDFRSFGVNRWIILGVALILLFVVADELKSIYVDWLWFDGAGYRPVYSKMITTRVGLFFGGALVFALYFGSNVYFAMRPALAQPASGLMEAEAAALRRLYLLAVIAATLFFAVIFGTIASSAWDTVLLFLNARSFGSTDPQFHRDIGFFVFKLPALTFALGWFLGLTILTTLAASGLYLYRYLVVGVEHAHVRRIKAHLCLLLVAIVLLFIFRYWLRRFELDFSTSGVVFGATYTDIHARLPFIYAGMAMAIVTLLTLMISVFRPGIFLPIGSMGIWVAVVIFGSVIYPASVQRFTVLPNELDKERPYIERNIQMTRAAFGLDKIDEEPFPAQPAVTSQEIAANPDTLNNIRLLDVRPLLQTYAQIQTIRPLYEFLDVDVDRYIIDGVRREVMLSARELSSSRLPAEAQSWVNRRLQYTHGYGAVVSPVNSVVEEGLPDLYDQDIPVTGSIPITQPEIYYGEEPEHYVIVKTKAQEFDYPVENGNVQTVFKGGGGVKLGSIFKRLIFAWQFKDLNIAISGSLTNESRILFRRNITDRIHTLAPFLTLDKDPYLVIADGKLYWMQDAYTTTTRYPYSKPNDIATGPNAPPAYNYIRNSVKIVVDAYDGTTTFYLVDNSDPIANTYAHIFPNLFKPIDDMPASIRAHVRYPEDLFLAQVNTYRLYHITDAGGLYNKEDIWNIPTEFAGNNSSQMPVSPYYVIMRIPGEATEEFSLILPMVPARRSNTIAWVAARSDGADYGKLLSFHFPTESLVFGPQQVESRIDQDPNISAQFSLWNQSGSSVIRGNLLMIPIGAGNLFVEPIYLQAASSQLPELKRVVVANGNQIAMEATLDQSLAVIFGKAAPSAPSADTSTGAPNNTTPQAPPATTPNPTATPAASATPSANATPAAAVTPGSVADLARQADSAYQAAQTALRNGDFTTYGQQIAQVEALIQQIVAQSGP